MKKTLIAVLPVAATTAFIAGMAVVPNTFAASPGSIANWDELSTCLQGSDSTCTLSPSFSAGDSTAKIQVNGTKTLNLNGATVTGDGETDPIIEIDGGDNLVIQGDGVITSGKQDTTKSALIKVVGSKLQDSAPKLTINNAKLEGWMPIWVSLSTSDDYGSWSTITINNSILNSNMGGTNLSPAAIYVNGNIKDVNKGYPTINITGSQILANNDRPAIYQPGLSDTTVNGSTIRGGSGVVIKGGDIKLNNTTVTATGAKAEGESSGDGYSRVTGAAIQIDSNTAAVGDIDIVINDGTTLASEQGDAIQAYGNVAGMIDSIAINGDNVNINAPNGKVLAVDNAEEIGFPGTITVNGKPVDVATLESETAFTTIPETPTTPEDETTNPNTADPIALYATIATVALLGLGATALIAKKANR